MEISRAKARIAAGFVAAALAAGGSALMATPASAAFDGHCGGGELCLYYNSDLRGGVADFSGNIPNHGGYNFWGTGGNLNDNAASARNRGSVQDVHIHEHDQYRGATRELDPGVTLNSLGALANENTSHRW